MPTSICFVNLEGHGPMFISLHSGKHGLLFLMNITFSSSLVRLVIKILPKSFVNPNPPNHEQKYHIPNHPKRCMYIA